MEITRLKHPVRVATLIGVLAVALLISGCAFDMRGAIQKNVSQNDLANGNEPYFNVGGVTYQIQSSRQLNPFSNDVGYFTGLKDAQSIPGSEFWYGVFLWAKNQQHRTMRTATENGFVLTDSNGTSYKPVELNSNINPWVWTSEPLAQNGIEPEPDSIAGEGPAGGQLILFELPQADYQDRPLTLHIYPYGSHGKDASAVSLDF